MAQAFERPHDARVVLHTILSRVVRSMGCTTILIVEMPHGESRIGLGIEEFVADGIIVLKRRLLERRPFRELEILKMRGSPTPEVQAVFTLKDGFKVFTPFKPKPVERPGRFKPRPDTEDVFSSGSSDLDEMLGGGYPRGSLALMEVDGRVSIPQYHLVTIPTAWNFVAQGRAVVIVPSMGVDHTIVRRRAFEGGFTADEVNSLLRIFVRQYPELKLEPYIVTFKGEGASEDFEKYAGVAAELRRRTRKPLLHIIGVDTLVDTYGEKEALWLIRTGLTISRAMGDLFIALLKPGYPRVAEVLGATADVHLKVTREHGVVLIYGVKPRTNLHVLEMDVSEGYSMPKLMPII
jgi:hypothetical protein